MLLVQAVNQLIIILSMTYEPKIVQAHSMLNSEPAEMKQSTVF